MTCAPKLNSPVASLYADTFLFSTTGSCLLLWFLTVRRLQTSFKMETKSNLKGFAHIKALGHPEDPTIILGYYFKAGGYWIKQELCDKKHRIFRLQFLLLGKENHMTMCYRVSNNDWILYDNDSAKPTFQSLSSDQIKDYEICLAGYVNISQAQEYKLDTFLFSTTRSCLLLWFLTVRRLQTSFKMETKRLLEFPKLMREGMSSYIKADVFFCSCQLNRSCLLDSLLAGFHIIYKKSPHFECLFNTDKFGSLAKLKHVRFDHTRKEIYYFGYLEDSSILYYKLVCAKMKQDTKIANNNPVYEDILVLVHTYFNLKEFDKIKALGHPEDPTIILGHHFDAGGYWIEEELCDKKNRIFRLQFLLLEKENHMNMCYIVSYNNWILYDNDSAKPTFQSLSSDQIKDYMICLAGYVNISQAQEYKLGIPEIGEDTGAQPFYLSARSSVLNFGNSEDVEMEDLSSNTVAIHETNYSVALPMLLQVLMSDGWFSYIKADALFCSYQLKRSCVLDSLLAAFHITFNLFPNVKYLFNTDEFIQKLMTLLNAKKYAEAKVICAKQLKHVRFDHTRKEIDYFGRPEDHSILYHKLVCAETKQDQKNPNNNPIYEDKPSNLKGFDYVEALGHPEDPTIILGYYFKAGGYWIEVGELTVPECVVSTVKHEGGCVMVWGCFAVTLLVI